jgi:hypothetical protein
MYNKVGSQPRYTKEASIWIIRVYNIQDGIARIILFLFQNTEGNNVWKRKKRFGRDNKQIM